MCISLFPRCPINWYLTGYTVGRGHYPPDQVPISARRSFNGIARKSYVLAGASHKPYDMNEPFSVQPTDRKLAAGRRGHDPALRNTPTNSNLSLCGVFLMKKEGFSSRTSTKTNPCLLLHFFLAEGGRLYFQSPTFCLVFPNGFRPGIKKAQGHPQRDAPCAFA